MPDTVKEGLELLATVGNEVGFFDGSCVTGASVGAGLTGDALGLCVGWSETGASVGAGLTGASVGKLVTGARDGRPLGLVVGALMAAASIESANKESHCGLFTT